MQAPYPLGIGPTRSAAEALAGSARGAGHEATKYENDLFNAAGVVIGVGVVVGLLRPLFITPTPTPCS